MIDIEQKISLNFCVAIRSYVESSKQECDVTVQAAETAASISAFYRPNPAKFKHF